VLTLTAEATNLPGDLLQCTNSGGGRRLDYLSVCELLADQTAQEENLMQVAAQLCERFPEALHAQLKVGRGRQVGNGTLRVPLCLLDKNTFELYQPPVSFSILYVQSTMVAGLMALLPPGIEVLEIAGPCSLPVMAALQRLPCLRGLRISGMADDWHACLQRNPRALLVLDELFLDLRREPIVGYDDWEPSKVSSLGLTEHAVQALQAATRLSALRLRAVWDEGAGALLGALPALTSVG
jgi:hypothetical protein